MASAFIFGIIQGALLAMLLNSLMPGLFGSMFLALGFMLEGASVFSGIILFLVANAAFYFLFSARVMGRNPMQFYGGALVGFALLFFFGQ